MMVHCFINCQKVIAVADHPCQPEAEDGNVWLWDDGCNVSWWSTGREWLVLWQNMWQVGQSVLMSVHLADVRESLAESEMEEGVPGYLFWWWGIWSGTYVTQLTHVTDLTEAQLDVVTKDEIWALAWSTASSWFIMGFTSTCLCKSYKSWNPQHYPVTLLLLTTFHKKAAHHHHCWCTAHHCKAHHYPLLVQDCQDGWWHQLGALHCWHSKEAGGCCHQHVASCLSQREDPSSPTATLSYNAEHSSELALWRSRHPSHLHCKLHSLDSDDLAWISADHTPHVTLGTGQVKEGRQELMQPHDCLPTFTGFSLSDHRRPLALKEITLTRDWTHSHASRPQLLTDKYLEYWETSWDRSCASN